MKIEKLKALIIIITSIIVTSYAKNDLTSALLTDELGRLINKKLAMKLFKITDECIDQFEEEKKQQATLNELPTDKTSDYWALNDVGTCYYIKCEALAMIGDKNMKKANSRIKETRP